MPLFEKFRAFFGAPASVAVTAPAAPMAVYGSPFESANDSPRRARVPGGEPKDYKHDLTPAAREDITKKTRYANKNSGITRGIVRDMTIYSVGGGITVQSNSPDTEEKRKLALDAWALWTKSCDITGRFSFAECQRMICTALDVDGEIFVLKVIHPVTKEPRIQLIESHRVGDFGKRDTTDGVKFDQFGAPITYRMLLDDGTPKDVPAAQVLHIYDPESPSAARACSPLQHGANHVLDEIELLAIEKHNVKVDSDIPRVIKTQSGNFADGEEGEDFNPVPAEGETEASDPAEVQKVVGGRVIALATNESMESYESKRPSPTFTGFLKHIQKDSTAGTLPYAFTSDPSEVGGAAIRLVATKADRVFSLRQDVIIGRLIEAVWFFVMGTKIDRKEIPAFVAWWNIACVTPRKLSTDAARDSAANRADVDAGLKCFGDHFGENGTTFEVEMERRAKEVQYMMKLAEKYEIPLDMLFRPSRPNTPESGTPPTTKPAPPAE